MTVGLQLANKPKFVNLWLRGIEGRRGPRQHYLTRKKMTDLAFAICAFNVIAPLER